MSMETVISGPKLRVAPPPTSYRMCARCIMDTSDPEIRFNDEGVCNHCHAYVEITATLSRTPQERDRRLQALLNEIRAHGRGKEYDCVIGVSGGVDSTFVAYKLAEFGIRPLAVHLDNGWDSELAVHNIEKVLKKLNIDLYTHVLDWEEFKDLQLSFLRASVSDAEIPTDHAIFATLYKVARNRRLKYIINGLNTVTEAVLPGSWTYGIHDWKYISSVHKRFRTVKLRTFPHHTRNDLLYYEFVLGLRSISLLDYIPYLKTEAMDVLQNKLGWQYYGGKHYESIYTRFFQGYILPRKFGIDKRRAHFSNLICSGQMTRDVALEEMKNDPYPEAMMLEDRDYVKKKLGLTEAEFGQIMALPIKTFRDYPNYEQRTWADPFRDVGLLLAKKAWRISRRVRGLPLRNWL
jgi:N-acetyl sugar amidotransferase